MNQSRNQIKEEETRSELIPMQLNSVMAKKECRAEWLGGGRKRKGKGMEERTVGLRALCLVQSVAPSFFEKAC